MNARLIKLLPGVPAAQAQINQWRQLLQDLRPLFPVVVPFLVYVFITSYNKEQDRMRKDRLAPILRPEARLPEDRPQNKK